MSRFVKLTAGLVALIPTLMAGLYGYRELMLWEGRTPEGHKILTALAGSQGFEPTRLPSEPVLDNRSRADLVVDFGYRVGAISYSYSLSLRFPDHGNVGKATLAVRRGNRSAWVETGAVRRWDEPRKAYAVAMEVKFDSQPPVPALCIKAVIGPSADNYDLARGSLCVARRDAGGECHPDTLACGLIR